MNEKEVGNGSFKKNTFPYSILYFGENEEIEKSLFWCLNLH